MHFGREIVIKKKTRAKELAQRADEIAMALHLFADLVCRRYSPAMATRIDHAQIIIDAVARDLKGMK